MGHQKKNKRDQNDAKKIKSKRKKDEKKKIKKNKKIIKNKKGQQSIHFSVFTSLGLKKGLNAKV